MSEDHPLFVRRDTPTVMDGIVVRWQLNPALWRTYSGEINASREGVGICRIWPIMDAELCVAFEEQLARARVVAADLRRQYDLIGLGSGRVVPPSDEYIDHVLRALPRYDEEDTPNA